jgi:hypothetical protein
MILMVLVGALLLLLGGAFVASPNAGDVGDLTGPGLLIFLVGLLFVVAGVLWWRRLLRMEEGRASAPLHGTFVGATERPEVAMARMEAAQTAFQAGEFKRALESLWDEVYEASHRRDNEQLEAVKGLAEEIGQSSAAPKRTRKNASHLADTATAHLDICSEQVAGAN